MKIGLIRHFPVIKKKPVGFVLQSEMLAWFEGYQMSPIQTDFVKVSCEWDTCFVSNTLRGIHSAQILYEGHIIVESLLNEPKPAPIFKKDVRLPFFVWMLILRLAYIFSHRSQPDNKKNLQIRLNTFLETLVSCQGNKLVVSHLSVMEVLSRKLIKHGFKGRILKRPPHGRLFIFEYNK